MQLVLPARLPIIIAVVLGVLALPAAATADDCVRPFRTIGPLDITRADIRTPSTVKGKRANWKLDATWTGVRPRLSQHVRLKSGKRYFGSSFSAQRAMSIDAYGPEDHGWMWVADSDPKNPPCTMIGRSAWQAPKVFVRETRTRVYVTAASQPATGDRTGCVLGPDHGTRECPLLTRNIVKLKKPVGTRKIVFEFWGPDPETEPTPFVPGFV